MIFKYLTYDELPEERKEEISTTDFWDDPPTYLAIIEDGSITDLFSDVTEPEDATFHRDLAWILPLLKKVYKYGYVDGMMYNDETDDDDVEE